MRNDSIMQIESSGYKAYFQFEQNSDIQLNAIKNELAKALSVSYARQNKYPSNAHDYTLPD